MSIGSNVFFFKKKEEKKKENKNNKTLEKTTVLKDKKILLWLIIQSFYLLEYIVMANQSQKFWLFIFWKHISNASTVMNRSAQQRAALNGIQKTINT